ncbi:ABC transporter substrate-binding protein [Paenibacillus turpanensis]|uniref:ABC transporter substrate-binding protein n=1 Tax=Paenibacillus turpanensis TaxID=2689078 RepID=UPI0031329C79
MKLWLWLVLVAVTVAGCGGANSGEVTEAPKAVGSGAEAGKGAADASAANQKTVYPLKVKDASGIEFTFTKAPERIVSLSPSETEVLFALGLGDRVVGVTKYCDYPEEAKAKPKIGSLQGDAEAILSAKPDLVVGGLSINKKTVESLRGLGLTVFTVDPRNLEQVYERIELIGQITDTAEQAEKVIADMKAEAKQVADAVSGLKPEQKKKVYVEFSPGWTVGSGEFMHELLVLAGGINVAADQQGWVKISEEAVIQSNPDVIIYSKGVENLESTIKGRSGWDKIAAITGGQMVGVDDNLLSRPGPRVTKGLLAIAKGIYPDLVK